MGEGVARGWWSAALHGHRRGWPHGRARAPRRARSATPVDGRSVFVDDGRRARWGLLLGYGTGAALAVWLVLVAGSMVGAQWLGTADAPGPGSGPQGQAFESPADEGRTDTTVAAARRASDDRSGSGDLQALRAVPTTGARPDVAGAGPEETDGDGASDDEATDELAADQGAGTFDDGAGTVGGPTRAVP